MLFNPQQREIFAESSDSPQKQLTCLSVKMPCFFFSSIEAPSTISQTAFPTEKNGHAVIYVLGRERVECAVCSCGLSFISVELWISSYVIHMLRRKIGFCEQVAHSTTENCSVCFWYVSGGGQSNQLS